MARSLQKPHNLKVVILAAGYATRLYPLTLNIPKPLLKVKGNKAVVDFIVDDLQKCRLIDEIIVVTNHKFYHHFRAWAKKRVSRLKLIVLDDETLSNEDRLGAVGDIYFAVKKRKIASDLLVVGGDNLFDRGFGNFLKLASGRRPFSSLGLFDIKKRSEAVRFGVVSLDKSGRVRNFQEKPGNPKSTLVATCLYYFPKEALGFLSKYVSDKNMSKDASGNYIRWLLKNHRVYGYVFRRGQWYDIGHLDSYKEVVARFN